MGVPALKLHVGTTVTEVPAVTDWLDEALVLRFTGGG